MKIGVFLYIYQYSTLLQKWYIFYQTKTFEWKSIQDRYHCQIPHNTLKEYKLAVYRMYYIFFIKKKRKSLGFTFFYAIRPVTYNNIVRQDYKGVSKRNIV